MTTTLELRPDAPHSPERTQQLVDAAAEAVRVLNYATMAGRGGLIYPGDVYSLLGALGEMAERFPQLYRQISVFLSQERNAGHLAESADGPTGGDTKLAVLRAVDALALAGTYADEMCKALDKAQAAIRAVSYVGPDSDDEQ